MDFESNPVERVRIVARDGASLTKHANERASNLTINVIDDQELELLELHFIAKFSTPPNFISVLTQPLKIAESLPVGSKVFQAVAEDGDKYSPKKNEILYEILENEFFEIDPFSGWISSKKPLDRESKDSLSINIIVRKS